MKLHGALIGACLLLMAVPHAFADGIDFTSNRFGDRLQFSGTGHSILTRSVDARSMEMTSWTCRFGESAVACGWLNFTTGSMISAINKQDRSVSGCKPQITGMLPGMSKELVLLTANFISKVTVTQIAPGSLGGTLLVARRVQASYLDPTAIFHITILPINGSQMLPIIIRMSMGADGAFNDTADGKGIATTPEPPPMMLLGTGLLGLAGLLRRKFS